MILRMPQWTGSFGTLVLQVGRATVIEIQDVRLHRRVTLDPTKINKFWEIETAPYRLQAVAYVPFHISAYSRM